MILYLAIKSFMITVLSRSFRYAFMLSLLWNSRILAKPPRLRTSPS
ncbi:hypothetical protein [Campylobacter sp.]|nr:hypothetical protein [Campylobacter sp.]